MWIPLGIPRFFIKKIDTGNPSQWKELIEFPTVVSQIVDVKIGLNRFISHSHPCRTTIYKPNIRYPKDKLSPQKPNNQTHQYIKVLIKEHI